MNRHRYSTEEFIPVQGGWVYKSWCSCGFRFRTAGETERAAENRALRRFWDHAGFAVAAGPGWVRH